MSDYGVMCCIHFVTQLIESDQAKDWVSKMPEGKSKKAACAMMLAAVDLLEALEEEGHVELTGKARKVDG